MENCLTTFLRRVPPSVTIVELRFPVLPRIDTFARVSSFQYLFNRITALNSEHHLEMLDGRLLENGP